MHVRVSSFFEEKAAVDTVPSPLKHCMVAVNKKGKGAKDAWNICRASQHRRKNLKGGYSRDEKLKPSVAQTQRGKRAADKHSRESGAEKKSTRFSKLFRKIEPAVT